jgi:hypothetical protein
VPSGGGMQRMGKRKEGRFLTGHLIFFFNLDYSKAMKQTVTIEIADNTVLQLLRTLASMSLIRFTSEMPSQDDITARLNEIYNEVDSSLDPCYVMAQAETLESEDW